jgi:hypothetical protein
MKKTFAALTVALTVSPALADSTWPSPTTGHIYDTVNQTEVLSNDASEIGRVKYAKMICHRETNVPIGLVSNNYLDCLRKHGFLYVPLTAEELEAQANAAAEVRQAQANAADALRARQMLGALGQGLIDLGSHPWLPPCQRGVLYANCR